ncbi:MAG: aminoacyl-tRNA hydrolase [Rhodothermales bacterium]|nr:aminoacyl-tRNA hydrolase [Rhodothermales bacterium]
MARSKRLIVGLGNPGAEYADTRHNVGFMVVDALAASTKIVLSMEAGPTLVGWTSLRGFSVGFAKPLTYMNRCGGAIKGLLRRHQLSPADMLVVVDDIHLSVGAVRIRQQGSAGGHNGVQDIIDSLQTNAFPRIRIGIGNDFPPGRQADYVLEPFDTSQAAAIETALGAAHDAARVFVTEGITVAMNRFNTRSAAD